MARWRILFRLGLEILNGMAADFGYRPLIGDSDVAKARDMMTTRQVMKFLGIPSRRLPSVAGRGDSGDAVPDPREVQPIRGCRRCSRAPSMRRDSGWASLPRTPRKTSAYFLKNHDLEIFDFVRQFVAIAREGA